MSRENDYTKIVSHEIHFILQFNFQIIFVTIFVFNSTPLLFFAISLSCFLFFAFSSLSPSLYLSLSLSFILSLSFSLSLFLSSSLSLSISLSLSCSHPYLILIIEFFKISKWMYHYFDLPFSFLKDLINSWPLLSSISNCYDIFYSLFVYAYTPLNSLGQYL